MIAGRIPQKQNAEIYTIGIDFTENLFGGSVASCDVTSHLMTTGADTTATIIVPASTQNLSPIVLVKVKQGAVDETHMVQFRATMSGGEIIEDEIVLGLVAL